MQKINITEKKYTIPQSEILWLICKFLNEPDENIFKRMAVIAEVIASITDPDVLKETLTLLRKQGMLKITFPLDQLIQRSAEKTKILSSAYSTCFLYGFYHETDSSLKRVFGNSLPLEISIPELKLTFSDSGIEHNIDEVVQSLQRKMTYCAKESLSSFPVSEQKENLKKLISSMAELDFVTGGSTFSEHRDFLKTTLENITENDVKQEKYYHVFKEDGFQLFDYLMKNCVKPLRGRSTDIAYFYWRMYDDGFMMMRPERFMQWLREESPYRLNVSQLKPYRENDFPERRNLYRNAKTLYKN